MARTFRDAIAILLVMASTGVAVAQDGPPMLVGDAAEKEALASLDKDKPIRAREQAQKILDERPKSFLALWVMSQVFHQEEANLPRALFLLRKAKKLFVAELGDPPPDALSRRWHEKVLMEEHWLLGEMDRDDEQVKGLDRLDELYPPARLGLRMWPLMKLRRFDEARALGRKLAASDDFDERVHAWNGLIATEAEALLRKPSYDVGLEGIEATQGRSCVLLHNTAGSALAMLRFDESEALAKRALKADVQDCSNSSYSRLAITYLDMGQYQKTISSLESLRKAGIAKRYRDQFEMGNRSLLTLLLHTLGKLDEAERFARDAYRAPDRTGMTSSSIEEIKLGQATTYAMVLEARIEQELERASVRPFWDSIAHLAKAEELRLTVWEVRRAALQLAADEGMLVHSMRPYIKAIWPAEAGHLAALLGRGVAMKAIAGARAADSDFPPVGAYFDAFEGEIAWRGGDMPRARELGLRAIEGLPRAARLMRMRTSAWLGDALYATGDSDAAREHWYAVLSEYPSAFRNLGVVLPVTFSGEGSDVVVDTRERLEESRRLRKGDLGFAVEVFEDDTGVGVCLRDRTGLQLGCAHADRRVGAGGGAPGSSDKDDQSLAVEVADLFHDKVLAPKVELTQSNINSLDGSPMRVDADAVLDGLLDADEKKGGKGP